VATSKGALPWYDKNMFLSYGTVLGENTWTTSAITPLKITIFERFCHFCQRGSNGIGNVQKY